MNLSSRPRPLRQFRADEARVEVFTTRDEAGRASAMDVAETIAGCLARDGIARVIFAAAPSQDEFLAHLSANRAVDWARVSAYHMDEYLGIGADHPSSFRRYLQQHLIEPASLPTRNFHEIPAENAVSPLRICLDYENALRDGPPDLVCGGIGENGHLAFNDPPVADFLDPVKVKVVRLDDACRGQQVNDGCFASLEDVPSHAVTLTIPALMAAAVVSIVVPGERKAAAVREAFRGPISEACPASILRRHPGARLYLDAGSANLL